MEAIINELVNLVDYFLMCVESAGWSIPAIEEGTKMNPSIVAAIIAATATIIGVIISVILSTSQIQYAKRIIDTYTAWNTVADSTSSLTEGIKKELKGKIEEEMYFLAHYRPFRRWMIAVYAISFGGGLLLDGAIFVVLSFISGDAQLSATLMFLLVVFASIGIVVPILMQLHETYRTRNEYAKESKSREKSVKPITVQEDVEVKITGRISRLNPPC